MKISQSAFRIAVERLRPILQEVKNAKTGEFGFMVQGREEVFSRYQPIFHPDNVGDISADDFKSFLNFSNNHHWKSIHRGSNISTQDMKLLREALSLLVDEKQPIQTRLNKLISKKGALVPRLGRAVLTPILMVVYPEKYGVWNTVSEGGMINTGVWPEIDEKEPFGDRYFEVNEVLTNLSREIGTDLWTLVSSQ